MDTLGKRIKQRREQLGLDQVDLKRLTGVSQPTIANLESGKNQRTKYLPELAKALKTSVEWLSTGKGDPEDDNNVEDGPNIRPEREYPLISWVQAGAWTELQDQFQPGDAENFLPCHKNLGRHGYVLRVKGKSMTAPAGEPYTFPEGILLYVNPEAEAVPGKFVIVRRNKNTEATFKRLVSVDGELYLEALNPEWPNRYLKLEEGDQFCGVVMHAGFDMP